MERKRSYFKHFLIPVPLKPLNIKNLLIYSFLLPGMMLLVHPMVCAQRIYPGAEGFGTDSRSAYGGSTLPEIVFVENLNDSGPGSFRRAVSLAAPRIVVFNVSGTIHTTLPLLVRHPYLFVAGQSAPGKGITFSGVPFIVETHDVLIQSVRFRLGAAYNRQSDCVSFAGTKRPVYNVVFDRCSFAFGLDENIGILDAGKGITISNSIIGFALNKFGHSCGLLAMNVEELSVIGNVFAFNRDRNPNVRGGTSKVEIINNLIYDSGAHAIYLGSRGPQDRPIKAVIQGNLYITGADNMNEFLLSVHRQAPDTMQVYWHDNNTRHKNRIYKRIEEQIFDPGQRFSAMEQPPFKSSVKRVLPAATLMSPLLDRVGPKPLFRDAVDSLIISNIKLQKGRIINSENETGLVFEEKSTRHCFDMPPAPHEYPPDSDFTNLELYLNRLL